jgi:hypothetical protein
MKTILGALVLVPLMEAFAMAQEPTADAKAGKFYLEGGVGIGVASMAADASSNTGLNSEPEFSAGFAAEYGITDQIGVFTKFAYDSVLHNNPGVDSIGMTFDGAFKLGEKKGDVPALSAYAGLGFVNIDVSPKGVSSEDKTDFVFEFGFQAEIGPGDPWSLQPFAQIQLVAGSRPFKAYNGVLQVSTGIKALIKLAEQIYLEPSVIFTGGNSVDNVIFGVGIQVRL